MKAYTSRLANSGPDLARHDPDGAAKDWIDALFDAALSGVVAAGATAACVALAGERDSGSAVAAVNVTSPIAWGDSANGVKHVDAKHTLVASVFHVGACIFWGTLYEKLYGRAAERGEVGTAMLGGAAVAAAAYVTDYHVVPRRLSPGWEKRLSGRSLAAIYSILALSYPLRGLLQARPPDVAR